jgi:uncharacterized protein YcaQ
MRAFPVIPVGKLSLDKKGNLKSSKKLVYSLADLQTADHDSGKPVPVIVRMDDDTGYIIQSNWKESCQFSLDDEMRVIGPLDPVIWDRDLLKRLFDFDYVWEVYKKVQDRVWGYYVYPLLYTGSFIGRIEAKYDKKTKSLNLFNFQVEKDFIFDEKSITAFKDLCQRWREMTKAESMSYDTSVPETLIEN